MEALETLVNGDVVETIRAADPAHVVFDGPIAVPLGGWVAARVIGPKSKYIARADQDRAGVSLGSGLH